MDSLGYDPQRPWAARRSIPVPGEPAAQRLAIARELLEDGTLTVEEVAQRCGLGSTDNLQLYFRRHLRTTPSAYQRAFSATAADHR